MGLSRHFYPIKLPSSGNLEYPLNSSMIFTKKISNFPSFNFLLCRNYFMFTWKFSENFSRFAEEFPVKQALNLGYLTVAILPARKCIYRWYIFKGTCLMCRIGLKAMNSTQYPSTILQGHNKAHEWNASFPTMSSGDLPALISKWLKKREKYSRQRYLRTLCRSVVPRRCTTRFRPAVRLCQLEMVPRCFPILCPRQDSEGEKSRPLDHMRQIPFVSTSVPPYWLKLRFCHVYIRQCSHFVFHVVRFEVWACARAKTI